jgi:integrase
MAKPLDYLNRKTAKGKPYVYFRSPVDGKLTPLPSDETSIEFKKAYQACLKSLDKQPAPAPKPRVLRPVQHSGTIGAAITRYKTSTAYAAKKTATKYCYEKSLTVLGDSLGDGLLCDLDTDAIDIHTEDIAKQFGYSVADRQVRLISSVWQACKKYPEFGIKGKANPADDAELRYKVKRPSVPWTEAQQATFMQTAPEYLRLAKLLLHFSAQRGGDCAKMLWSQFDGKGLWVTPEKSDANPNPLPNYHKCPKPLLDALNAAPRAAETILTNSRGQPWACGGMAISHAIRNHLIKIGLAKRGQRTISMHGLRKNAASEVAQLLVGTAGVKTVTGHRSNAMAEFYAQHANTVTMNEAVVRKWDEALEAQDGAVRRRRAGIRRVK